MSCSVLATMEVIDNDFEQFFVSLKKENFSNTEIENICKPLKNYYRKESWKNRSIIVISLVIIYALVVWCDCFNWLLSVLYRVVLIQLLPYWNWPTLYNAKCLIDRPMSNNNHRQAIATAPTHYETDKGNCVLCDNIEYIPSVSNITFSILENAYIESGLPVVITDSHDVESPSELFHTIFDKSVDFLQSSHCDVASNLIIKKFFDAEVVLRKAWKLDSSEKYFIQLRNCQSSAVKSSRLFIKRPYYYPLHLEPFYSSWLIMSQNFLHRQYQELHLQGLIIIQQLYGSVDLRLIPKKPCLEDCPVINIQLKAGEGLVFSTDLWILNYKNIELHTQSITTIMEIDWTV